MNVCKKNNTATKIMLFSSNKWTVNIKRSSQVPSYECFTNHCFHEITFLVEFQIIMDCKFQYTRQTLLNLKGCQIDEKTEL